VNLLVGYSSPLLALGFLGPFSYAVRELIGELAIFGVGFAVLFLVAVAFLLYHHVSDRGRRWFREQTPQWNRASRDWMVALFRNEQTPVLVAVSVKSPAVERLNRTLALARMPE
jgi:hypothetical protein